MKLKKKPKYARKIEKKYIFKPIAALNQQLIDFWNSKIEWWSHRGLKPVDGGKTAFLIILLFFFLQISSSILIK